MRVFPVIAGLWIIGLFAAFQLGKPPHQAREKTSIIRHASSRLPSSNPSSRNPREFLRLQTNTGFQTTFETLLQEPAPTEASHDDLFILADLWASKDPAAATAWLADLELDDARNPYLFSALSQWAMQDITAATAFLDSLPNANRDYLLAALVRGLATHDPDAALDLLLKSPASPERTGSLDFILNAWSQISLEHAFQKLPTTGPLKAQAIQKLTATLTRDQFVPARTWAQALTDPSDRQSALTGIAARWSQSDPVAATAWAASLADPQTQSLALGETATRWARRDPAAASAWLAENPNSPTLDLAARSIAASTIGLDPAQAFSQIATITHAPLREESFEQIGRFWLSSAPQKAKAYLQQDTLVPAPIREQLLQSFE
ncbi:hypothetical protein V2O64_16095 [Verrucomicrobiaceae bacterium 227]